MFEYILLSVVVLFAIIGLSEVLHKIYVRFLTPRGSFSSYLVTFAKGENAVQRLRADLVRVRWNGKNEYEGLIFFDCGIGKQEADIIKSESEKFDDLIYAVKEGKDD